MNLLFNFQVFGPKVIILQKGFRLNTMLIFKREENTEKLFFQISIFFYLRTIIGKLKRFSRNKNFTTVFQNEIYTLA